MIILENYDSMSNKFVLDGDKIELVEEEVTLRNGVGALVEGDLVAIYAEEGQLFFYCNKKAHGFESDCICCQNNALESSLRELVVKIKDDEVCCIRYESYVNPLALSFEEDKDEFDFLGYLSKILELPQKIDKYFKEIDNLNKFYSHGK